MYNDSPPRDSASMGISIYLISRGSATATPGKSVVFEAGMGTPPLIFPAHIQAAAADENEATMSTYPNPVASPAVKPHPTPLLGENPTTIKKPFLSLSPFSDCLLLIRLPPSFPLRPQPSHLCLSSHREEGKRGAAKELNKTFKSISKPIPSLRRPFLTPLALVVVGGNSICPLSSLPSLSPMGAAALRR